MPAIIHRSVPRALAHTEFGAAIHQVAPRGFHALATDRPAPPPLQRRLMLLRLSTQSSTRREQTPSDERVPRSQPSRVQLRLPLNQVRPFQGVSTPYSARGNSPPSQRAPHRLDHLQPSRCVRDPRCTAHSRTQRHREARELFNQCCIDGLCFADALEHARCSLSEL